VRAQRVIHPQQNECSTEELARQRRMERAREWLKVARGFTSDSDSQSANHKAGNQHASGFPLSQQVPFSESAPKKGKKI